MKDRIPRKIEVDGKMMIFSVFDPYKDNVTHDHDILQVDEGTKYAERTCLQISPNLIGKYVNSVDILRKPNTDRTYFRGTEMEQYVGILYFVKKYPNDCVPIEVTNHVNVNKIFISWNMEKNKLIIPEKFEQTFAMCKSNSKIRFICSIINLLSTHDQGHANGILYDKKDNTIEIYEPYGSTDYVSTRHTKFYEEIIKYFKGIGVSTVYLPCDYCPKQGHQEIQVMENKNGKNDPTGFCSAWSLWWIDYRLKNADSGKSRSELYDESVKILMDSTTSLTQFIRNYANFVYNEVQGIKEKILSKNNLTPHSTDKNANNYVLYEKALRKTESTFNKISRQHTILINIRSNFDNILIKGDKRIISDLTNNLETIVSAYGQLIYQDEIIKGCMVYIPTKWDINNEGRYHLDIIRLKELRNDLRNNIFQKPYEFKEIIEETIEQNIKISKLYSLELCKLLEIDLYIKIKDNTSLYMLMVIQILKEMKKYSG